jgi:hypothetical protein
MNGDIVWSEVITITGNNSVLLQTGARTGFMFIESKKWCEACNRVCAHFGFIGIGPGPLGEMSYHPIKYPEL